MPARTREIWYESAIVFFPVDWIFIRLRDILRPTFLAFPLEPTQFVFQISEELSMPSKVERARISSSVISPKHTCIEEEREEATQKGRSGKTEQTACSVSFIL